MRGMERSGGDEEPWAASVPPVIARHDSAEAISSPVFARGASPEAILVGLSMGGDSHASLAMTKEKARPTTGPAY